MQCLTALIAGIVGGIIVYRGFIAITDPKQGYKILKKSERNLLMKSLGGNDDPMFNGMVRGCGCFHLIVGSGLLLGAFMIAFEG